MIGKVTEVAPRDAGHEGVMVRTAFVIAVFAATAGAARIVQDAVIAWRHGASAEVDAYWFVINLVGWPVAVMLSTLTLVVAPAEATLAGDSSALRRFRGETLGLVLAAAAIAIPLSWWALRAIVASPLTGLGADATALAVEGARVAFAVVPLGLVGALLSAWLIASARRIVTLLEGLPALCLAALVIALPGTVLFWGTAASVALQVGALAACVHLAGGLPIPRLGFTSLAWRGIWRGAVAMLAGQVLFALIPLVDQFFAARLGEGVVASLNYANRLLLGLQGLAGLALQRASLPLLSRLTTASPAQARRTAMCWAALSACAGVGIAVVVVSVADPALEWLFERGSFTTSDRQQVVTLLRWGALQLPVFLAGLALVTALAATRAMAFFAVAASAGFLVKLALNLALVREQGAIGLQMATAAMYLFTAAAAWLALLRRPIAT